MNQDTIKKMLVGLIVIIALAIGVTLVISMLKKDDAPQTAPVVESPIKEKKEVPVDKLPDKFPVGLPVEAGATISQNYNASTKDGRFQATRVFESKASLADSYALYTKWLTDNGWTLGSKVDTETYKMVSGSKTKQELQISIDENAVTKVKTVSMSLTELPQ